MATDDQMRRAAAALQKAVDEKNRRRLEADRKEMVAGLSGDFVQMMKPALNQMVRDNSNALNKAIGEIKNVQMPEVVIPDINIPTPQVDVNVDLSSLKVPTPEVKVSPIVKLPDFPKELDVKGWIGMMGYNTEMLANPLPVQLRDANGKPVNLIENLTAIVGTGGGRQIARIGGVDASAFASYQNADGRLKVSVETGGSGLTDTELRAAHLDVQQLSGSIDSVNLMQTAGNATVVGSGYQDNALRVVNATDAITSIRIDSSSASIAANIVDSSGVAYTTTNPLPVTITSGGTATSAVNIVDSTGVAFESDNPFPANLQKTAGNATVVGTGYQDNALRVVNATDAITSVRIDSSSASVSASIIDSSGIQYSGSNPIPITWISGSGPGTTAANIVDSTGVAYEGANPFPITIITSATASVNASIIDSSGVGYSGSNPVPVTLVAGATQSTMAVGDSGARAADNGGNPVKVGGIARQTNPTAYADGDRANFTQDDLGRQLIRPIQVRDLTVTAYATFATGTEATLVSAAAATYLDLIYILASNNSTAAVGIDIRPSTAGSIVMHLEIPANGTVGVATPVPIPQQATGDGTGGAWTVDLPDITGTTVSVSGLFTKEI